MDTSTATQVLGQFLLVSLLVERIIAVGEKLLTSKAAGSADDVPDPRADPWDSWSKGVVVSAFIISFIICYLYKLDFFDKLLAHKTTDGKEEVRTSLTYFGYFLSSIVLAGGSSGIQKILAAISANAKASKQEARARLIEAQSRIRQS
jgi:hypothetical protein